MVAFHVPLDLWVAHREDTGQGNRLHRGNWIIALGFVARQGSGIRIENKVTLVVEELEDVHFLAVAFDCARLFGFYNFTSALDQADCLRISLQQLQIHKALY